MDCCGRVGHTIDLRGDGALRLVRCAGCDRNEYRRADGGPVPVDAALAELREVFRDGPRAARAARDRAATATAARRAARTAAGTTTGRPRSPVGTTGDRVVDRPALRLLLHGWSVLGATG